MEWMAMPSDVCSIARTLAIVGDRWTLLILRDVINGIRRFDDLARHLGVARDVLSRRLGALVDGGILDRVPYREPGSRQRHEYRLTEKGRDLSVVLVAIMAWGDEHLAWPGGPPLRLEHRDCGEPVTVGLRCAAGHDVTPGPAVRPRPTATATATARATATAHRPGTPARRARR
jgi:DNA-binding HxlR family transcriptional regulator